SYERRLHRGLPFCGASNPDDTRSGGSKEVYLRLGKGDESDLGRWEVDLGLLAYTHVYSMPGDSFGNKKHGSFGGWGPNKTPAMRAKTLDENALDEALTFIKDH